MKRVIRKFFFAAAIAIAAIANVEAQNSFAYQAVIRSAKGELVSNQEIGMQISLLYNDKVVYCETHTPKTNQYGNVQVEVGKGQKVSGDFAAVPWSTMKVMMKIEADPNGGTNYIDLGTIQLQPAPYAMYAPAAGAVSTIQAGDPKSDSDALFEVKDKDGNVVFAVYPDGVRVFVDDSDSTKAARTGFAVAGRRAAKEGEEANYFEVTTNGTQVFVDEDNAGQDSAKAMNTGFAVSGRRAAKDVNADLFTVGSTGTQVYIDEDAAKAARTGFAVAGRRAAKDGENDKYLEINPDGTRVYIDSEEDSTKAMRTGFAVSGRRAAKDDADSKLFEINADGTRVYVDDDQKAARTGFAVAGRRAAKGNKPKLFEVNSFGTQIYIETEGKPVSTGFAVSGRRAAKAGQNVKYMVIDADGTRIYVDYDEAKAMRTGFAVSGRRAAKDGEQNTILEVNNQEGTRAYVDDIDGKPVSTGFAVSGRRAAKEGEPDLMRITSLNSTITAANLAMQDKKTNNNMMSITPVNTKINTDELRLLSNDDSEVLSTTNGNVDVKNDLVVSGEVAQNVDATENEDVKPLMLSAVKVIETVKIADTIPGLDAPKGYAFLKIYGNGKFAQTKNIDSEKNAYMFFSAAGNLVANQSDAVAAVIMTKASTPDAQLIIWPLKQVNALKISFGLMAEGDTSNCYVPVEALINAEGPVECLVDVKSANEELGKVRIEGPKVYGSKVDIYAETIVEGYHFAGWTDDRSANPRKELILHDTAFADATFAINTYNIIANAENGEIEISGEQNDDGTFNHGTEIGLKPFASEHYHFMGWTDGEADAARNFKIVSDTTFEAIFAIDSFDIKTNLAEGGSVTGVGKFPYGAEIELVATPDEANGYHFVNWNDGNADNPRKLIVEDESTFTAYFDKNRYLLTYVVDGEVFDVDTIACDAQIVPINAPDKVGHNFKGWKNMQGVMPKDNLTVIAQYDPKTYTITFNTGDGSTIDPVSAVYNTTISEPKQPEYANHSFTGWFADADCTKPFDFKAPVSDNATVYAGWEVNSYSITIAQAEGGSADVTTGANAENNTYTHETQVEVSASPDDENGYEFVKWTAEGVELDKDQVNNRLLKFNITSDVKLTPVFALKKYHINATAEDGGSISTDGLDQDNYAVHGTKITLTAAPTDNTYEFKGWQIIGTSVEGFDLSENQKTSATIEIEVKNDFDIKAKFDLITYPVVATTDGNGSVRIIVTEGLPAEGDNYIVGTVVTIEAKPKGEAYEFDQWTEIEGITLSDDQKNNDQIQAITVESEIKVKATFKPKMAVTFVANDGGVTADQTIYISQGSTIANEQIPVLTREGYSFVDWLDSDGKPFNFETKITDNITLTAQWAKTYYVASRSDGEVGSGTESNPFASVQKAFEAILDDGKTNTDYRIVVVGTLEGGQKMQGNYETSNLEGSTITLIGFNELDNGQPIDKIDGGWKYGVDNKLTNTYNADQGAALTIYRVPVPVVIKNLAITGGYYRWGGGVSILAIEDFEDDQIITIGEGTVISGNYALCGSGLCIVSESYSYNDQTNEYSYRNVEVTMDGGIITNNEATGDEDNNTGGGGVLVDGGGSKFVMKSGAVKNNSCVGSGGGVYVGEGSVFVMAGGVISGNEAVSPESDYQNYYGRGGGVYNEGVMYMYGSAVIGDTTKKEVPKTDAHSNMAKNGGGIFNNCGKLWIGYKPAENEGGEPVADNDFAGGIAYNYASANGGGIGLGGYDKGESNHIYKCKIAYNAAAEEGGGIGRISDNSGYSALYIDNSTIVGNKAGINGGGLYLNNNYLEIDNMSVKNTTISNNTAGNDGGGLYFGGGKPIQLSNCEVTGNATGSEGNGGGIYFFGNYSSFALDGCQVTGNSALKGAGVYLVGDGELHMNSSSITGNVLHEDPNEEDIYDDPHGKGVFINYSSEMYVSGAPVVDEVYGEYPTVVYIELEKIEVYDDYGYSYYEDGEPLQLSSGARITVTPEEYKEPDVYEDELFTENSTPIIGNCTADNCEYFSVTRKDDDNREWCVNPDGYLIYYCTIDFTGVGTEQISAQTVKLCENMQYNPTNDLPDDVWQQQQNNGYIFAGWAKEDGTIFYPQYENVTDDMTLSANWVKPFTDIYVNTGSTSSVPNGTSDNPFQKIQDAIDLIASFNQSDLDYTIHVTGMDNNSVIIPEDRSYFVEYYDEEVLKIDTVSFKIAKSILVKGEGDESGINASQPVCVYTSVPVTFKNFNVTVGNNFTIVDDAMSLSVGERADVTLANGTDLNGGKNANDHRYAIVVRGKLTMDCANIHDYGDIGYYGYNTATNHLSGGIWVDGGELLMKGNSSIYGCFGDYGGAIHIERGTVTMEGDATIGGEGKGCKASSSGGAVYINEGSFKMDGSSSISYCTKGRNLSNDGSVSIYNGQFTMKGYSKIHHNAGSGVYVDASTNDNKYNTHGTFKMEGGSIKNNSEDGVYVNGSGNNEDSFGVFEMSGGTISDNIGHGVFVYVYSDNAGYAPHGIFKMSGSANVDAEKDDVYLCYSGSDRPVQAQVTIAGALQNELTITPKNYNTTLPLVAVVEGVETTFEANLSKFKVSPYQPLGCDIASGYYLGSDGTVYANIEEDCNNIATMSEDATMAITAKIGESDKATWLGNIANVIGANGDRVITLDLSNMIGVTEISGFNNIPNLAGIVLPEGITSIGSSAFSGTGIALIDIPKGVETIGEEAFKDCANLESAVLPASLTTIGANAFAGCNNLKTIYFRGTSDQMSELLIGISDDDPLKKAQWICNSVSLYVSPNGSDGYYNGQTAAKPCQNMDGIRGGKSIFDKIRNDFSQNNNIIVFVSNTMTGTYTLYATDVSTDNIWGFNGKVASITFCGLHGLRNGAPIDVFDGNDMNKDVFTIKTTVPITFKNVKITNGKRGVFACGSSSSNRCNVTLGSGSVVTGNGSSIDNSDCCGVWVFIADVTLDGGKITANKGKEGGGVHLSHSEYVSKFTMKSGSIETNEAQKCGGVYVTSGTSSLWSVFSMQGGTIRGNTATTDEGKGVYIYGQGTFEMSGSAYINPDNDVWFSDKIKIAGALTTNGIVATITPSSYGTTVKVLDGESSLVSSASGKFAVTDDSQGGRWVIGTNGYLKDGPLGSQSQPGAVGDIVFSDGTAEAYTSQLSDKQKNAAVAVIYYVSGSTKYGVGLNEASMVWATDEATCLKDDADPITNYCNNTSNGLSNNIPYADGEASTGHYPAMFWNSGLSGGYLPSSGELSTLLSNKTTVNNALNKLGKTTIGSGYWSSTVSSRTAAYYDGTSNTADMTSQKKVRFIKRY